MRWVRHLSLSMNIELFFMAKSFSRDIRLSCMSLRHVSLMLSWFLRASMDFSNSVDSLTNLFVREKLINRQK